MSLPNRNDMDSVTAGEAPTAPPPRNPHPATILGPKELPPAFLIKTYDMVEDPLTDEIISWSPMNNSFVVWNPTEFGRDLLPKYFKHNNFSSFVRQLNTYGFRKVDPDRCEFANEGFLRGHKHLLKSVSRRKSAQGQQGSSSMGVSVSPCVEVGKFGLEEEVEQLKRDKNVLMQELVKLRQQQQSTDNHLQNMVKRQQSMESRQQQMMCFLAKAVQNPVFVSQLIQKQGDGSMRVKEGNKKRRLREDSENCGDCWAASDGQIVKYQPFRSDSMIWNIMKTDDDKVPFDDGVSSPNRGAGVSLQEEVPTTSGQSRAAGQCVSYLPSTSTSLPDTVMPTIPPIPESTQVIINDIPTENYMDTEKNNPFFDCGSVSIQPDEILQDPNMSELMSNCDLLEEYLAQSPVLEENNTNGGSMDKIIEELDLLTSEKTEQL